MLTSHVPRDDCNNILAVASLSSQYWYRKRSSFGTKTFHKEGARTFTCDRAQDLLLWQYPNNFTELNRISIRTTKPPFTLSFLFGPLLCIAMWQSILLVSNTWRQGGNVFPSKWNYSSFTFLDTEVCITEFRINKLALYSCHRYIVSDKCYPSFN